MASDVRKPPLDDIFALHLPQERGKCRWCGKPTEDRDSRGKLRWWHPECEAIVQMLARPEILRDRVFKRDVGVCANCGGDWSERYRFRPEYPDRVERGVPCDYIRDANYKITATVNYNPIVWISLWHVEHRVPLWKVAHMPAVQRIAYFMLDAVETWCEVCHKFKTAKESADRAKINARLKEPESKPKRAWASRPLKSGNGFPPKGSQKIKPRPFQKRP